MGHIIHGDKGNLINISEICHFPYATWDRLETGLNVVPQILYKSSCEPTLSLQSSLSKKLNPFFSFELRLSDYLKPRIRDYLKG